MSKILIQIGAAEGNDHVTKIIKTQTFDKIILVEPNPKNFKLLKENYKDYNDIVFENIAISDVNNNIVLFADDSNISYHTSTNYIHLLAHGHHPSNIRAIIVTALTFKNLLKKHDLLDSEIEFLFIDTEGHDCDIILSIDFEIINIKNIWFECSHSDGPHSKGEKLEKTIKYLNSFGYKNKDNQSDDSLHMVKTNI